MTERNLHVGGVLVPTEDRLFFTDEASKRAQELKDEHDGRNKFGLHKYLADDAITHPVGFQRTEESELWVADPKEISPPRLGANAANVWANLQAIRAALDLTMSGTMVVPEEGNEALEKVCRHYVDTLGGVRKVVESDQLISRHSVHIPIEDDVVMLTEAHPETEDYQAAAELLPGEDFELILTTDLVPRLNTLLIGTSQAYEEGLSGRLNFHMEDMPPIVACNNVEYQRLHGLHDLVLKTTQRYVEDLWKFTRDISNNVRSVTGLKFDFAYRSLHMPQGKVPGAVKAFCGDDDKHTILTRFIGLDFDNPNRVLVELAADLPGMDYANKSKSGRGDALATGGLFFRDYLDRGLDRVQSAEAATRFGAWLALLMQVLPDSNLAWVRPKVLKTLFERAETEAREPRRDEVLVWQVRDVY